MTSFESLSTNQKIRATVHRDSRAVCSETCHFLGLEITKSAMEVIAELTYAKLQSYAEDLEAFAHHAKRNTINTEDVKLLVRRNPSLKTRLNSLSANQTTCKEKRRKTVATVAKQPEISNHSPAQSDKNNSKEQAKNEENINVAANMTVDDAIDLTFD